MTNQIGELWGATLTSCQGDTPNCSEKLFLTDSGVHVGCRGSNPVWPSSRQNTLPDVLLFWPPQAGNFAMYEEKAEF